MKEQDYIDNISARKIERLNSNPKTEAILGLVGGLIQESAELLAVVQKHTLQGEGLDHKRYVDELGDIGWYYHMLHKEAELEVEDTRKRNYLKLRLRHGDEGFNKNHNWESYIFNDIK